MNSNRVKIYVSACVLVAVPLLLLPYVELSGPNRGHLNFYSMAQEQRLGEDTARRFESRLRLVTILPVTAYLRKIGMTIASVTEPSEITYRFRLVESPVVNAMALPGGYIYVFSGLFLAARNEGELAGVLAHEIGHVESRHATEQLSRNQLIGLLSSFGGAFFGGGGVPSLLTGLERLSYSRGDEMRSDDLAVDYLYQAGYHPEAMATFFDLVWKSRQEAHLMAFLATHPLSDDRAARVRTRIATWPFDDRWIRDSAAFHEAQALLRASKAAKPDKNGASKQADDSEDDDEADDGK